MYHVGVDIGGTFTDCVIFDESGRTIISKAATTPSDPSEGVLNALSTGCQMAGLTLGELFSSCHTFIHGSTITTNAIIERTGAKTAFITTRGHEDMLIIGKVNQKRAGLSELELIHTSRLSKAEPKLVPRDMIFSVTERVILDGQIYSPLRVEEAGEVIDEISRNGVESVAVCFLWAFMNPDHEREIEKMIRERLPHVYCSLSSEVSPTFGEYERAVATVINAYVGPKLENYLSALQEKIHGHGYEKPLLIMQSGGGTTYVEDAIKRAVQTVDSGPVGGISGGRWLSQKYNEPNLICTDVGGTSFDVGLIYRGEPEMLKEPVIAKYIYRIPKVDIKSIGAGGGSIAWIDKANILRVGPQSAGADPGPACYGRGGQLPTVTDANLVLGYLNPDYFLGGTQKLDRNKAEIALSPLAKQIKMDLPGTAYGIFKIMNTHMADLIRKCTVERGFDPKNFCLLAYGGAGPTHVAFYGADIGVKSIYVLPNATAFSAFGMLTAPVTHSMMVSRRMGSPYSESDCDEINSAVKTLTGQVLSQFEKERISSHRVELYKSISIRYRMQVHELEVEIGDDHITPEFVESTLIPRFEQKYAEIYGAGTQAKEAGTEIITSKVIGRYYGLVLPEARLDSSASDRPIKGSKSKGKRKAFFDEQGQLVNMDTAIWDGNRLEAGDVLPGPSIVERYGDTVIIPPKFKGEVDSWGIIILTKVK